MLEIFALASCFVVNPSGPIMSCKILNPSYTIYSTREACEAAKRIYPRTPTMEYSCWRKSIATWERVE